MTTKGEAAMSANGKLEVVRQFARRGLVLAALLAAVLFGTGVTRAQSSATAAPASAVKPGAALAKTPASPVAKQPAKGSHEGIKVHGHWTIEVRNPDGSLVKHVDFENALCLTPLPAFAGGDFALANLLAGGHVIGGWAVKLGNPTVPAGSTPDAVCFAYPPSTSFTLLESNDGDVLSGGCLGQCIPSLNPPALNSSGTVMTLAGQFTVPQGTSMNVSAVYTFVTLCSLSQLSGCLDQVEPTRTPFTGTYLSGIVPNGYVPVTGSQTVAVTVQLSFQ